MTGAGQGATGTVTETTAAGQAHACASLARRRLNEALEYVDKLDAFTLLHPQKVTYPFGTTIPPESHVTHDAHAALLLEVEGLKAALRKSAALIERMYLAGPDCDCEPEGHHCGWPSLRDVHEHNQRALSPASGGGEAAALPSQDSAPQNRVANLNKAHSEALQDIWWVCESRMRAEQKVAEIRKITANQDLE